MCARVVVMTGRLCHGPAGQRSRSPRFAVSSALAPDAKHPGILLPAYACACTGSCAHWRPPLGPKHSGRPGAEKFNLAGPEVDLVPLEADYSGRCCCASAPTPAECTCVGGGGGGGGAGAALGTPGTGDYQAPLFECTSGCSCPAACGNRSSQRGVGVPVEVFEAPGRGFGLRAAADIRKGQYCCSYNGEIVTMAEARRRLQACDATKQSNYLLVLREHIGTRILRTHSQ